MPKALLSQTNSAAAKQPLPFFITNFVMEKNNLKALITCFSPDGQFLAVLCPNGILKIWNTSDGTPLAEWKQSEDDSKFKFTCMECSFIGKKRRKGQATCLVALGTDDGNVLAINAFTGETEWKSTGHQPSGITALSFVNKGRKLFAINIDGMAHEIDSETGEVKKEVKVSNKSLASSICSCNEKIFAAAGSKIRILSLVDGKELLNFASDSGVVRHVCTSDNAQAIITSGLGEKTLNVWKCDSSAGDVSSGPVLLMRHPPFAIECKKDCDVEDGLVILSVSEAGVAYIWNLKTSSEDDIKLTKITVKAEKDPHSSERTTKSRTPIFAARIHSLGTDSQVTVLVAYGSIDCPQFSLLEIASPGEDLVVVVSNEMVNTSTPFQEKGVHAGKGLDSVQLEAVAVKEKTNKKRAASELESADSKAVAGKEETNRERESKQETENFLNDEPMDGVQTDDDLNDLTMGEKLASLNIDKEEARSLEKGESSPHSKPPSADSVHVLLKQALHADDRALLLDCLNRHDEKVVNNSVTRLNPSDVFKLLDALISIIHSRGAVLVCALPWLRSLLLQHSSSIMSQESSLLALNSLYQLIEARIASFNPAVNLLSSIDMLYSGKVEDGADEDGSVGPLIYEDYDDSDDEEGSEEETMETDEEVKAEVEDVSD